MRVAGGVAATALVAILAGCAAATSPTASAPPSSLPSSPSSGPAAAPPECPGAPPRLVSPLGGRLPGQDGPLLAPGITAIRICEYAVDDAPVASTVLTGSAASGLADRLNALPMEAPGQACTADAGPTLVLLPRTASQPLPPVVAQTAGCGEVTNGVTRRSGRGLVRDLAARLEPAGRPGAS